MGRATRYTSEFRAEAVRLARDSDEPIYQTALSLGVNEKTLYNWVAQSMRKPDKKLKDTIPKKQSLDDAQREIARLKKALLRAEMERDILKKAAAFFANQEQ